MIKLGSNPLLTLAQASKLAFPSAPPDEEVGLKVVVIDDELTVGPCVRDALRDDGHVVHVRTLSDAVIEEIDYLQPDAVVLHLDMHIPSVRVLTQIIRARFPAVHLIVYTNDAATVRRELEPDLVLSKASPFGITQQTRCWARHV